jgi:DNA-binding CsgD family transcriptional regulator
MNPLTAMLNRTSIKHADIIKSKCTPLLEYLGVNHVSYSKINRDGNFVFLTNYPEWMEHYFGEGYHLHQPHFRHPAHFMPGISLPKNIADEEYQRILQAGRDKFNIHSGVVFIDKLEDGIIFYAFDLIRPGKAAEQLLISEMTLLKKFWFHFVSENQRLFRLLDENCVNLAALLGDSFYQMPPQVMERIENRRKCLEALGLGVKSLMPLTDRELNLLEILQTGESSAQIGKKLYRSKRTIEKNIDRLKEKLCLQSKSELINLSQELHAVSYFDNCPK